jgi:Rrf2 family protein
MQYSRSIEYAIHGLVYLAGDSTGNSVLLSDIAKVARVPREYMRKVFQLLSRANIVTAQRGAGGGYRLARSASEITLQDVVETVEGSLPLYNCLQMRRGCGLSECCPVKEVFDEARQRMSEVLRGTTIQEVNRKVASLGEARSWLKVTT